MIIQDDRSKEQKSTHYALVVGTDTFLSGWGEARGGSSYAAWAVEPEEVPAMLERISARSDMIRVRVVYGDYRPNPRNCAHLHIYVAHC